MLRCVEIFTTSQRFKVATEGTKAIRLVCIRFEEKLQSFAREKLIGFLEAVLILFYNRVTNSLASENNYRIITVITRELLRDIIITRGALRVRRKLF